MFGVFKKRAVEHDFEFAMGPEPAHDGANKVKIAVRDLSFWYGDKQALFNVTLDFHLHEAVALIGPSGCGKSTLLRCLNRTNDGVDGARRQGSVLMDGEDIYSDEFDPPFVRRRFGWIAQKPDPFPASVYENVAYGPILHGMVAGRADTDVLVEKTLRRANLWDEVKDDLHQAGTELSGGQQQRLCIARALAYEPEVMLLDEPCSALDPIASAKVEALIDDLRERCAVVIITHNMQQAARVAQSVAVLHMGELVEKGDTRTVFENPQHPISVAYLKGYYG